jgi:hypothetical protein
LLPANLPRKSFLAPAAAAAQYPLLLWLLLLISIRLVLLLQLAVAYWLQGDCALAVFLQSPMSHMCPTAAFVTRTVGCAVPLSWLPAASMLPQHV